MVNFAPGFDLPPFYCPTEYVLHPDLADLERRCITWIDEQGLCSSPLQRAWSVTGTRVSLAFCGFTPESDPELLYPELLWAYWVMAIDDAHLHEGEGFTSGQGEHPEVAIADLAGKLNLVLAGPGQNQWPNNRFVSSLSDIGDKLRAVASPAQYARFTASHLQWSMGELWAAVNRSTNTGLTLEKYLVQRNWAVGLEPTFALNDISDGVHLSAQETHAPLMQAARQAASSVVGWDNDLISYPKEVYQGDTATNGVTVMANHLGCPLQDAVAEVVALRDRTMALFLALADQLDRTGSPAVLRCTRHMRLSVRSILEWSSAIPRYRMFDQTQYPEPVEQVPMEWTTTPSDPSMSAPDLGPIAWWWDQLESPSAGMGWSRPVSAGEALPT